MSSHFGNGRKLGVVGESESTRELIASSAADEVAHVRARFGVDPSTPSRLADAWQSPTGAMEEDESEFLDAVADCLSVGLPMDAAVASWRSGTLEVEGEGEEEEEEDEEEAETGVYDPHKRGTGRRLVVR